MIKDYAESRKEIYCLVAEYLNPSIIEKEVLKDTNEYYIKIKTKLDLSDFTRAEIRNNEIEKQEEHFSWQEEMEQYVYKTIRPGEEISRAYRYLRKKEWRMAIIYLNHLQKKYPNWHEIYFAKAVGYYAENKPEAMVDALNSACSLGNNEACEDLKGFSEDHSESAPRFY
jgi:tetratricopeptide (TPR) repeat protein